MNENQCIEAIRRVKISTNAQQTAHLPTQPATLTLGNFTNEFASFYIKVPSVNPTGPLTGHGSDWLAELQKHVNSNNHLHYPQQSLPLPYKVGH